MVRDLAMAFSFGDHPAIAAFMVAFRLSNLFRRLLGEGPLQSVFIPHFEALRVRDPNQASTFFRKLNLLLFILLIVISVFSELILLAILNFYPLSVDNQEIIRLTAWMLPGLIFICLYGINISVLQCYDSFFLPSFAPFVCNAIWIFGALFFRNTEPSLAMIALSKLVVIGFFFQWLITFPSTFKNISGEIKEWVLQKIEITAEIRQLITAFGLGIIVVGASQINGFLDAVFARYADLKGPVYLWYSIRLEQLALAIFGMACVSPIIPTLSRAISAGHIEESQGIFAFSFRRILSLMIPCTFALFFLGLSAINLIYGRGHFSPIAVEQTALCLWGYGIGLLPSTIVLLFFAIFYAKKSFRTASFIALGTILLHMAFNSLFVFVLGLGAISTALATSISAWIQCIALSKILLKQGWRANTGIKNLSHLIFASSFASGLVVISDTLLFDHATLNLMLGRTVSISHSLREQFFCFTSQAFCFIAGLWLYATTFKIHELLDIFKEFGIGRKKAGIHRV